MAHFVWFTVFLGQNKQGRESDFENEEGKAGLPPGQSLLLFELKLFGKYNVHYMVLSCKI